MHLTYFRLPGQQLRWLNQGRQRFAPLAAAVAGQQVAAGAKAAEVQMAVGDPADAAVTANATATKAAVATAPAIVSPNRARTLLAAALKEISPPNLAILGCAVGRVAAAGVATTEEPLGSNGEPSSENVRHFMRP